MSSYGQILVMMFLPISASAQIDTLTLDRALGIAREKNLAIAIAASGERKSDAKVHEVTVARYPGLGFRTHYLYAPVPGYNEVITNAGEYGIQVGAAMQLYDGGIRSALINQAANDADRSKIVTHKTTIDIGYAVRASYAEVQRNEGEVRIRQETVNRLADYGGLLERLQRGGVANESDVLKARVDQNNAVIALEGARQALQKSKIELNAIIGRSLTTPFDVVEDVREDSASAAGFEIEANADFQLAQRDEASAGYDLSVAEGERLPTLSVVGDAGFLGVHPTDLRQDKGFSLLLSLEIPLIAWGGISDRIEQRQIALDQMTMQRDLAQRELEERWRLTVSDLDIARRSLDAYRKNAAAASDNYLSAKSRFVGGTGSNLEVLDAQRLLMETKLNENTMTFQIRLALANLRRLRGEQ